MPHRTTRYFAIALFTIMVAGCAVSPGGPPTLDQYKPIIRMGVSIATDRLIVQDPDVAPVVFQIASILVDTFDGGDFTSITQVADFVRSKIPWSKFGDDLRPLVEALLVGISEELRVLVTQHQIPETQTVLFGKEIMMWVREAAQRHIILPLPGERKKIRKQ